MSNLKIDELLRSLDETVDSLESGLNCNDETRKIVLDWLISVQRDVQRTFTRCTSKDHSELFEAGDKYCYRCGQPLRR